MIRIHWEVRMTNDGEDGNGQRYELLKKRQDDGFSKFLVWLEDL